MADARHASKVRCNHCQCHPTVLACCALAPVPPLALVTVSHVNVCVVVSSGCRVPFAYSVAAAVKAARCVGGMQSTAAAGSVVVRARKEAAAACCCSSMARPWLSLLVGVIVGCLLSSLALLPLLRSSHTSSSELVSASFSIPGALAAARASISAPVLSLFAAQHRQTDAAAAEAVAALDERGLVAGWKVVASVFMGRRDRAHLTVGYLSSLQRSGLVDEIHLWDFTHDEADRQWLLDQRPALLATATQFGYVHSLQLDDSCAAPTASAASPPRTLQLRVSAASDVHLRLSLSTGEQYELVLGALSNQASVFRRLGSEEASWLYQLNLRLPAVEPNFSQLTLSHNGSHFALQLRPHRSPAAATARDDDDGGSSSSSWIVPHATDGLSTARWTAVAFSTGYGSAGVWDVQRLCDADLLPANASSAALLRICYSQPSLLPDWSEYYRHYAHHRSDRYARTVLLKLDDDVVYIDQRRFRDFINFRIRHPEHMLLFPNIVNNAVAAYFQQRVQHVLPPSIGRFRMEAGGPLWQSARRSRALHELFLQRPEQFVHDDAELCYPLPSGQRFSINFFALLSEHLDYFVLVLRDGHEDEHQLTVDIASRYQLSKCVYPHLVVSHLAFGPQQTDQRSIEQLIAMYDDLWRNVSRAQ